jgi:hypothetical protein
MPISNSGWELHIVRTSEQARSSDGKRRTVGKYQVFHDGVAQTGPDMKGMVAETRGPGANRPRDNGRRVEAGSYPISTQAGGRYVTIGYVENASKGSLPKPGLELDSTGQRTEILIHPGSGFLSSVGCINPCTSLPNGAEPIDFGGSRRRTIALIEDLKAFLGSDFPTRNGRRIPRAVVVIDGEPTFGS